MKIVIESKLKGFSNEELLAKKDEALEYLSLNPFDTVGCAKEIGMSVGSFFELRNIFMDEFRFVEEIFYSKCEHVVARAALGDPYVSPKQVGIAKWVIERRRTDWAPLKKLIKDNRINLGKPNGRGEELIKEYQEKKRNENQEASGEEFKAAAINAEVNDAIADRSSEANTEAVLLPKDSLH